MATLEEELKQIADIKEGSKEAGEAVQKLTAWIKILKGQKEELSITIDKLDENFSKNEEKITSLIKKKSELTDKEKEVQEALNKFSATGAGKALTGFGDQIKSLLGDLKISSPAISDFATKLGSSLFGAIEANAASLGALNPKISAMINTTKDWKPITSLPFISNLNDAMKGLLTTQAVARRAFTSLGDSVGEANRKSLQYLTDLRKTSVALGIGREDQQAFNSAVAAVPGALEQASNSLLKSVDLQGDMVQTSGILQTALQRFKMTGAEAGAAVQSAFLTAGLSTEQFANFLGQANSALRGTDVDAKIALNQMLQANNVMGIFGNQASRVTGVWHDFTTTLRSSGVAIESIGQIVTSVTQGISNMSTQNRAFIGMMSGMFRGATALGGALKMELAMRSPGGLEQNLEALTGTIAKFAGGKIITLEEAANNPQLEMQFTLQRQMLQKMGMGTTTEQQNRILEVMQGVQRGGISQLEGSKELGAVMNKGRNIQEQLLTAFERQENILRDKILTSVDSGFGGVYNQLMKLNTAFGIGDDAFRGITDVDKGAAPLMGRDTKMQAGTGQLGDQLRRNLTPAITPEGDGGSQISRRIRRDVRSEIAPEIRGQEYTKQLVNALNTFTAALSGQRLAEAPRPVTPATLATPPTAALTPAGINAERLEQSISRQSTETKRRIEDIRTSNSIETTNTKEENSKRAENQIIKRTKSEIRIKIDGNFPEIEQRIMKVFEKVIEKEMKNYITGERTAGE